MKVSSKNCIKVEEIWVDDGKTRIIKLVQPYTREDLYNTIAYNLWVLDYLAKKAEEWNDMSDIGVSRAKLSMDIINKCLKEYAPFRECEDARNSVIMRMYKAYYTIYAFNQKKRREKEE